jgi:hypothetical protein
MMPPEKESLMAWSSGGDRTQSDDYVVRQRHRDMCDLLLGTPFAAGRDHQPPSGWLEVCHR